MIYLQQVLRTFGNEVNAICSCLLISEELLVMICAAEAAGESLSMIWEQGFVFFFNFLCSEELLSAFAHQYFHPKL